jgi:predicted Fe-Mo cluster-binding NifX family protein
MRVLVSSRGKYMDSMIAPRFGRCRFFVIVETENMDFEVYENKNAFLRDNAGINSAKFAVSKGVGTVLTGFMGPKAFRVFKNSGARVFTGISGTVLDAVDDYEKGELRAVLRPGVSSKYGEKIAN